MDQVLSERNFFFLSDFFRISSSLYEVKDVKTMFLNI